MRAPQLLALLVLAAHNAGLDPAWAEECCRNFVAAQSLIELTGGPQEPDEEPLAHAHALLEHRIDRPGAGRPVDAYHLLPARADVPRIAHAIAEAWAPEGARLRLWARLSEAHRLAWEGAA